ncbi:MAG: hypothetical protein NVS9B1_16330 [Candidatus Dormibacteraceae bacterium]
MPRPERSQRLRSAAVAIGIAASLLWANTPMAAAAGSVTNITLGTLDPAAPAANSYTGCVASILAGEGFVFGDLAVLGSELARIWPSLAPQVATACRRAVDSGQPQVCVSPATPAPCPAVGPADAQSVFDAIAAGAGNWMIGTDSLGCCGGAAATPLSATAPLGTTMAAVSGTFAIPDSLATGCCGPVTWFNLGFTGRTPNESGVSVRVQAVDGHGRVVNDAGGFYGNTFTGAGCGGVVGECVISGGFRWICADATGAGAACGGQTLTVTMTFVAGATGCCTSQPPVTAQQVRIDLTTDDVAWRQSPGACPGLPDCLRFDDVRLAYTRPGGVPTVVGHSAAGLPSAVNDVPATALGCLVGLNVLTQPAATCPSVSGPPATIRQQAAPPIAPAAPPTVSAVSTATKPGSAGWSRGPVTVMITATDPGGPGVGSIVYSATGAQPMPRTVVAGSTAGVAFSADGLSRLTFSAVDNAGNAAADQTLDVAIDATPPVLTCAPGDGAWHSLDIAIACTAGDAVSGLADPGLAGFTLTTAVPDGTETTNATTGSRQVCDAAGNCAVGGPVGGLRVDRKAPVVTVAAPAGTYFVGEDVLAAYACSDGGSGVATCAGPVAAGQPVDTSQTGVVAFAVIGVDRVGNQATTVVSYTVVAHSCKPAEKEPLHARGERCADAKQLAAAGRQLEEKRLLEDLLGEEALGA